MFLGVRCFQKVSKIYALMMMYYYLLGDLDWRLRIYTIFANESSK